MFVCFGCLFAQKRMYTQEEINEENANTEKIVYIKFICSQYVSVLLEFFLINIKKDLLMFKPLSSQMWK